MESLVSGEVLQISLTFLGMATLLIQSFFPLFGRSKQNEDVKSKSPKSRQDLAKISKKLILPTPSEFNGVVQVDLGVLTHSNFGSVHVKSEFPRIKPKFEREIVSDEDIELLKTELMRWIKKNFDVQVRGNDYFEELSEITVLFSVYVNPFSKLFGQQMDLVIKIYFWLWYADDEIEYAIENGIPVDVLKRGTDQIRDVLSGITEFKAIQNYPFFESLFYSQVELHKMSGLIIQNYQEAIHPTQLCLQRYFEAQRWFSIDPMDERYSEESFIIWRRYITYFDGIAEVVAMVEGVELSQEIRRAPSFLRILDTVNSIASFVNDIIGMKKEFTKVQKDNFIVFKVMSKQMPLELAIKQVCSLIDSELRDYILIKKVILREFNNDKSLIKYLDILDSLMDGHNRIYAQSRRHRSVDCINLTRNR